MMHCLISIVLQRKTSLWKFRRKLACSKIISDIPLFLYILLLLVNFSNAQALSGGLFPAIKDLSSFGPVKTTSTCGLNNNVMPYCISTLSNTSLSSCNRRNCITGCCDRCSSSTPLYINLDQHGIESVGIFVSADRRPNSKVFSESKNFQNGGFVTYNNLPPTSNFTFAVWIKQESKNIGTLIQTSDSFTVTIEEYALTFTYKAKSSPHLTNVLTLPNVNFIQGVWHHIALVVCGYDFTLFIDGKVDRTETLQGILNPSLGTIRVGLTDGGNAVHMQYMSCSTGKRRYLKMWMSKFREVSETMNDKLPVLPFSNCRCPESHSKISPVNPYYCTKNSGNDVTGQVSRLSAESHPPEYLLDGSVITYWISEKVNDVSIEIDLQYSRLQVYLVSITFYSPPPLGISVLRSTDHGATYIPWQYFAVDCVTTFNMVNNGPLPKPDSVNCLQVPNPKPSWETITFQPAEAGPDNRPQRPFGVKGCANFHCSPQLMQFVHATNVKITFTGHTLVSHPDHNYFGVRRIVVGGSCDCYGHGSTCEFNENATPHPKYVCHCDPRTFTEGEQCERCMPLYRDKSFLRGTILNANPCKKCSCNNHADSCHYVANLDSDVNNRNAPGGGVCIGCKHNTIGRYCESCKALFYRKTGTLLNAVDVCQPCDCIGPGVLSGQLDCQKDDNTPGILAGQCKCKPFAAGRQCTECKSGYFNMSSSNSLGCTQCVCHLSGTKNSDPSCHISSGQCNCKTNVLGVKCTNCKYGFYGLSQNNPEGCSKCECNPFGSYQADTCNVLTGQCNCKARYQGRACDRCLQGYFGPQCKNCSCNTAGTQGGSSSLCDQGSGQCSCKLYVTGISCTECKKGYYGLSATNPSGCYPCNCDNKGTVGNTGNCKTTGVCLCKARVTGSSCNICKAGSYGLSESNVEGCSLCHCDVRGTVGGDNTPQDKLQCSATGQCNCLSNVVGRECNECLPGYYWNPLGLGCLKCNCDVAGSVNGNCSVNGQCPCKQNLGVGGAKCNQCVAGFYGFSNGRCFSCSCSSDGSVGPQCNNTGHCTQCKRNVEGSKCTQCKPGTINLQASNPYGCSGAPSEQGPPTVIFETPTMLMLSWQPPDDPNGIVTRYELYRNNSLIYSGTGQSFNDTGLTPYTMYWYYIIVFASGGSARNVDDLMHRTLTDVPGGVFSPNISQIKDRSVFASWEIPLTPNGNILHYTLSSTSGSGVFTEHYKGVHLSYQVYGLTPFTLYAFTVTVCNSAGCQASHNTSISTRSAAPDSQPAPNATPLQGGASIYISWDAPQKPNGDIKFYDLFSRHSPFVGEGNTEASSLNPSIRNYTVRNKQPFTDYEFRVVSYTAQVKGSRSSNWTRVKTLEGVPSGANAIQPNTLTVNSSTIHITWNEPGQPNGVIQRYEVFRYDNNSNFVTPILIGSTSGNTRFIEITKLEPYTNYYFSIKACNKVGCTSYSTKVNARTQASSPELQNPPYGLIEKNSTSIILSWNIPNKPNGPVDMSYIVEKKLSAYNFPPPDVEKGVRFPGFGYYQLPATLMPDSTKNQVEFYFKTRYADGLIFFAASQLQEDIFAIEFRDGCPWFVFDTESGAAAFTINKNISFNDNKWHHVLVTRESRNGQMIIDNIYQGSGSGFGQKNVIGQISHVFVGGLPIDFRIIREDGGPSTLKRMPFIGCMRGFRYKNVNVDFNKALLSVNVPPLSSYCPTSSHQGVYFKGGGYVVLRPGVFKGGKTFTIDFTVKTVEPNSILLFATSQDVVFALYISNSRLYIRFSTPTNGTDIAASSMVICDGVWHRIVVESIAQMLAVKIDGVSQTHFTLPTDMIITDKTYLGGIPLSSSVNELAKQLQFTNSFSGCFKDLLINIDVHYQSTVHTQHNVDFDGCPSQTTTAPCTPPQVHQIYDGEQRSVQSVGLSAFTEYLYRVKSYHQGIDGFAASEWMSFRSGAGAPQNLAKPIVKSIRSKSVLLSWSAPSISGGLITHYNLHAYDRKTSNRTSTRVDDIHRMVGNLSDLEPATVYGFTVEAVTGGGSIESMSVINKTKPAAPEGFESPRIDVFPTSFNISWSIPLKPNGDILFYQVDIDGIKKYSGMDLYYFVSGLQVYTNYIVKIYVCGQEGCASNEVRLYSGQLPPQGIAAPQLRVQGSRQIEVKWIPPTQLNGVISRYKILKSLTVSTTNLISAHNASGNTYSTVINNLIPGTTYFFRVKAFTDGGGTLGDASSATTFESAPENIPIPVVQALNSSTLSIQILQPLQPNGVIMKYVLFRNRVIEFESPTLPSIYYVTNLQPYSLHTFQVEVCTSKGCGFSNITQVYTDHAPPIGSVKLTTTVISSTSIASNWSSVETPNGLMTYTLLVYGEFYNHSGLDYLTVNKTMECYYGIESNTVIICNEVLPYSMYTIQMNASNNAGYLLSNIVTVNTPGDAPEGFNPPTIMNINPTAIVVSWSHPIRENGPITNFSLYQTNYDMTSKDDLVAFGILYQQVVRNLLPYTNYSYYVIVENDYGSITSQTVNTTTMEDVPEQLDAPKLSFIGSRMASLEISPPGKPNGIITQYLVYLNGSIVNNTLLKTVNLLQLMPFTEYSIHVGACTKVGCLNSSMVNFKTLQDVPEGMSAPILISNQSRTVIVMWSKPSTTNGIITCYTIQRRVVNTATTPTTPVTIVRLNASFWNTYRDNTVKPFTTYEYRVVAETIVGGTPSPYNSVTTPEGEPEWNIPPVAIATSSSEISVSWTTPSISNGIITHYFVKAGSKRERVYNSTVFTHTLTGLEAYVQYIILVSACTKGGCGDSPVTLVRTLPAQPSQQLPPTTEIISNSSLNVRWFEPLKPNGPILYYVLYGRVIESIISQNITLPTEFQLVYQGTGTVFQHDNLGIFSLHQYKVTCVTTEGNTTSNSSLLFRTGPGYPLAGPDVMVTVVNHTAVQLNWTDPPLPLLRGDVHSYTVSYEVVATSAFYVYATYPSDVTRTVVGELRPSTTYDFQVSLFNGAGEKESITVRGKTLAGVPEGFDAPVVYSIGSDYLRISWREPRVTNGDITNYTIIANDVKMDTVDGSILFHEQKHFKPYTDYVIKIQVCTEYSCILSEGTLQKTKPDLPTDLLPPMLTVLTSLSIQVTWKPPINENGIMVAYAVYRRDYNKCPVIPDPLRKCTYISCSINEQLCGVNCYDPKLQVCCNGGLHLKDNLKTCCEANYVVKNTPDDICCGGQFYPKQTSYQCCYGYYRQVAPGHVCCHGNNGVVTGLGDSCCGDVPYARNGTKECLCGALYDKYPAVRQCCGAQIISIAEKCCGDERNGTAHAYDPSKTCCGTSYVPKNTSLCCEDDIGLTQVHNHPIPSTKDIYKCCGTNQILNSQSCCNSIGYDNNTHSCADRSNSATSDCGSGKVCSHSQLSNAYCNRCDFDLSRHICLSVPGYYNAEQNKTQRGICLSEYKEILKNNNPEARIFIDEGLLPHTKYEYYVIAFNTEGNVSSPSNYTTTLMAVPEGLKPPVPTVISATQIAIVWSKPLTPNGQISEYKLYRVKWTTKETSLVYQGISVSHMDNQGLEPYTGYMYIASICTTRCANISADSLVYTEQAIPANIQQPSLTAISPYSIQVNWSLPLNPNGIITRYNITQRINGLFHSILPMNNLGETMTWLVNGLKPYTQYSFRVEACTIVGCAVGPVSSVYTHEAPPEGVVIAMVLVLNSRTVQIEWSAPDVLNGVLQYYILRRNGTNIFQSILRKHTDSTVKPDTIYEYILEAYTDGGYTSSPVKLVSTPESSPEGIPIPRVTALSSSSLNVSWGSVQQPNGLIVRYIVLYQEVGRFVTGQPTGLIQSVVITGLKAFTEYHVRIQACTNYGCGSGDKAVVYTLEASPQGQSPPEVVQKTSSKVELKWKTPSVPNGNITNYQLERLSGSGLPVTVYVGLRMDYIDPNVKPYRSYRYRISSINDAGVATSSWRTVWTLESIPDGLAAPIVLVYDSTSVKVQWSKPSQPNGVIKTYEIRSRLFSMNGNETVVKCCISSDALSANVSGFKPATRYEIQVGATTTAGTGYSPYTIMLTKDSLPTKVPQLFTNTQPNSDTSGTVMEIYWNPPSQSNGEVTTYILYLDGFVNYEGLERTALIRRLKPYTNYTFVLEMCNTAGCIKSPEQILMSGEVTPRGMEPPVIGTLMPSSIEIHWSPPTSPNGVIILYQVIREQVTTVRKRRNELIVFSTNDTTLASYTFTDTSLHPFTTYRYKIRAVNSRGSIDSNWMVVTTQEGAPEDLSLVNATALSNTRVQLEWKTPRTPNGIVRYYNIYRDGKRLDSTLATMFIDDDKQLKPNSKYRYEVAACTSIACTTSLPTDVITLQSKPDEMLSPTLEALGATRIKVAWRAPLIPNGAITYYEVYLNDESIPLFKGYAFEYIASGLETYKIYFFSVSGCTNQGCTKSKQTSIRTLEDLPEGVQPPKLFVIGSTVIEAKWSPPLLPNGVILYYVLRRDTSLVVYNGTDMRFTDRTVQPGKSYQYSVSAYNTAGGVMSNIITSPITNPSAPENISSPLLRATSSSTVQVTWTSPEQPNGVIVRYYILYDDKEIDVGLNLRYTVTSLQAYTTYDFRVKACTSADCTSSQTSSITTLEASPEIQRPPTFNAAQLKHNSIAVLWNTPEKPNGDIIKYELYRRRQTNITLVYSGPGTSFTDSSPEILPLTTYEYKVISYNSAGNTESTYASITTPNIKSVPTDVKDIVVPTQNIADTTFYFKILPPGKPYGDIINYVIEIRNLRNLTVTDSKDDVVIRDLFPKTTYSVRLYACNVVGCSHSNFVSVTTKSTAPSGFDTAPIVVERSTIAMKLSWFEPTYPNGVITRYDVIMMLVCPQLTKPECTSSTRTTFNASTSRSYVVSNLTPYTAYLFKIRVFNEAGYADSPSTKEELTDAADPVVQGKLTVQTSSTSQNTVILDWSEVFDLRSQLRQYLLYENNVLAYNGPNLNAERPGREEGYYTYKVVAETSVNGVIKTVASDEVQISIGAVTPTAGAQTSDGHWYETVWFLALCALVGIFFLLLIIAFCCWHCRNSRTVYVRQREPLPMKQKYGPRVASSMDGINGYTNVILRSRNNSIDGHSLKNKVMTTSPQPSRLDMSMNDSRLNDNFVGDDDFVWETTANSTRDLDSGLYEESPTSFEDTYDDIPTENGFENGTSQDVDVKNQV